MLANGTMSSSLLISTLPFMDPLLTRPSRCLVIPSVPVGSGKTSQLCHTTIKSAGKILYTSDMFTLLSLPVRSEISNCLVHISFTTVKVGTYFASKVHFCQNLIISKLPILNLGTLSCLSPFCLECASLVLRAVSMYVCHNLFRWVMPSSEPKYLILG